MDIMVKHENFSSSTCLPPRCSWQIRGKWFHYNHKEHKKNVLFIASPFSWKFNFNFFKTLRFRPNCNGSRMCIRGFYDNSHTFPRVSVHNALSVFEADSAGDIFSRVYRGKERNVHYNHKMGATSGGKRSN